MLTLVILVGESSAAAGPLAGFSTAEHRSGRRANDRPTASVLAGGSRFGIEQHSLEADPQFTDPAKDDFALRLSNGSPARKLGFEPIGISQAGPRTE